MLFYDLPSYLRKRGKSTFGIGRSTGKIDDGAAAPFELPVGVLLCMLKSGDLSRGVGVG
jgi:hypothetical protein